MRPAPEVLERLRGLRLMPRRVRPAVDHGERRSGAPGAGLEFIDHRPWREGDDIRRIDPRLMARLGQPFLRRHAADRRLSLAILLDDSPSMRAGGPGKRETALMLARQLGFIGLAGGDVVRICRLAGRAPRWSATFAGPRRAEALLAWLGMPSVPASGASFGEWLGRALADLPPDGLVVMIGDWLDAGIENHLPPLAETGREPVVIHVASPEEIDPALPSSAVVTLVDAETGAEIDLLADAGTVARYRALFSARQDLLRRTARRAGGWYFFLPATGAGAVADFIATDMRRAGLIR